MINSNFFEDSRVRSLKKFNEKYAFFMIVIFSLMPFLAMFSPQSFGSIFTGIAQFELVALIVLGAFQLISYASFSSRRYTTSERLQLCIQNSKHSLFSNKVGVLLLIVYVLSLFSIFFAKDMQRALYGTDFRPDGLRMYTCFLVVFVFASLIKRADLKRRILSINIAVFLLSSLIVVQQYYGIIGTAGVKDAGSVGEYLRNVYDNWGIRVGHFYKGMTGPFYNLNHMGYYITIGCMLVSGKVIMSEKTLPKVLWSLIAAYSFYVIIINDTFGCYLAIGFALGITGIIAIIKSEKTFKKCLNFMLPFLIFVCVSALFIASNPVENSITKNFKVLGKDAVKIATTDNINEEHAGSGRLEMYLATIDMIKEKPILGFAPDNLKDEYVKRDLKLDRAHNEILERAVATGIPSALAFYFAVGLALWNFIKRKNSFSQAHSLLPVMALIGYLISSMFGVFLFYTGGFFIMMLSFVTSSSMENDFSNAKFTKKR